MIRKLDILKALFDEFLTETQGSTVQRLGKKERIELNAQVFDFQAYVSKELKSLNLNLLLNPTIHSSSIAISFAGEVQPFSPNDYCLSFFDFLNVNKNEDFELYQLIDNFIELHQEELNWQDIVITASGATRCKTNLRFALDRLRKVGLIKKVNQDGKRVLMPTLRGELVFYNWRNEIKQEHFHTDNPNHRIDHNIRIDDARFHRLYAIFNSLALLKDDAGKRKVAAFLHYKHNYQGKLDYDEVVQIQNDLTYFLEKSIITSEGIFLKDDE